MLYSNSCSESVLQMQKKKKRKKKIDIRIFYSKLYIELMEVSAAADKSLQSYPTLCDPIDGSPPGSPVPGILQARTPEWAAISFSNAWKWNVEVKSLKSCPTLSDPMTAAYQAPPSTGFSRQEYWSGVPLPSLMEFSKMPKIEKDSFHRKNSKFYGIIL